MSPNKASGQTIEQPRLIIIAAPSGAGKTTLCEMILKDFPNVVLSVSATTRAKRPKEKNGVHYYFLTEEEFRTKKVNNEFAETAQVHGKFYGTPKDHVDNCLNSGKHLLFDIDVQGANSLTKAYPSRVLKIFVHPPSMEELEKRLRDRSKGDSTTSIETRLQNAYNELGWSKTFDYQITNDDLNRAYQELKQILSQECL